MSQAIDKTRRQILQIGAVSVITLLISRNSYADDLTDLIVGDKQTQVIAVRLWPSSIYTRLTIEAESAIKAKYFNLNNPARLVVDIVDAKLNTLLRNLSHKVIDQDPIIADIKVGQFDPDTVRVVIYLKQHILAQTRSIQPVNLGNVSYKYRYVLDMYPAKNEEANTPLNDSLLALLQLNNDTSRVPIEASSGPVANSRMQPYPELKLVPPKDKAKGKLLVMIDPGHGGEDPGAIGPTGTKEKHVVLDIAKKLHDIINQTDYLSAKLTRSQDIFIPLTTRVAITRKAKADLLISLHADAFTNPQAKGSSVFVLSDKGATSSFARWLAKTQNAADLIGGVSFQGKDQVISKILFDMTQTWTRKRSDKLGEILLSRLGDINKLHNRQVEKAGFAVLKAPDIPSTLVETAFISNPEEEELLKTPEFRQKIAYALFNGLSNFAGSLIKT